MIFLNSKHTVKFLAKLVLLAWLGLIVLSFSSNSSAVSKITEMKDQLRYYEYFPKHHIPLPSLIMIFHLKSCCQLYTETKSWHPPRINCSSQLRFCRTWSANGFLNSRWMFERKKKKAGLTEPPVLGWNPLLCTSFTQATLNTQIMCH